MPLAQVRPRQMAITVIEAHGLRRVFGDVVAVHDVSLSVPDGTILAILGPNGAGKTTTVRMLAGLLAPSSGDAIVAGYSVRVDPAAVRARVGLVTDTPGLYPMTLERYLDFFGRIYGLNAATRSRRIDELLELFDLRASRSQPMATFSRGMQQKVSLARALLHEPAVLFLDEPTTGLDPLGVRTVRDLILQLRKSSCSIVLCTHDLDEAERLADTVAIFRQGRVVAGGAPAALSVDRRTLVRVDLAYPCPLAPSIAAAVAGVDKAALETATVLTFRTGDPYVTNPAVIAGLVEAGAAIVSVSKSSNGLEDIYEAAVQKSGADRAG